MPRPHELLPCEAEPIGGADRCCTWIVRPLLKGCYSSSQSTQSLYLSLHLLLVLALFFCCSDFKNELTSRCWRADSSIRQPALLTLMLVVGFQVHKVATQQAK
jgi:hypothetical protein